MSGDEVPKKRGPKPLKPQIEALNAEVEALKGQIQALQDESATRLSLGNLGQLVERLDGRIDQFDVKIAKSDGSEMLQRVKLLEEASSGPFAGMTFRQVCSGLAVAMASATSGKQGIQPKYIFDRLKSMMEAYDEFCRLEVEGGKTIWQLKEQERIDADLEQRRKVAERLETHHGHSAEDARKAAEEQALYEEAGGGSHRSRPQVVRGGPPAMLPGSAM